MYYRSADLVHSEALVHDVILKIIRQYRRQDAARFCSSRNLFFLFRRGYAAPKEEKEIVSGPDGPRNPRSSDFDMALLAHISIMVR